MNNLMRLIFLNVIMNKTTNPKTLEHTSALLIIQVKSTPFPFQQEEKEIKKTA